MLRLPKFRLPVIACVGGALACYILKSIGFKPIVSAAMAVGWQGFTILYLYQLGLFVLLGTAWYVLVPISFDSRVSIFIWARMVRDATSELLPFSHLGGIVLGARAAISKGILPPLAIGSIVTDVATEMLAQIAFTALGVVILAMSAAQNPLSSSVASSAAFGVVTIALGCAAFALFQRYARALTSGLISRLFPGAATVSHAAVDYILEIYRRPARVGLSVAFHCGGWVASALSTWLALFLMGVHAHVGAVLAVESLVCAVRSVAFWMPNGLGVQEAAYAAIAPIFGIGAEVGLAISLLRRARDIAVGLPALLLWQWSDGRKFLQLSGGARASGLSRSR